MVLPICSICNKQYTRKDSLKVHVKTKHPSEFGNIYNHSTGIECKCCGKSFSTQSNLKGHVKRSHENYFNKLYPEVTYKFQCAECNKRFNLKRHLKFHLKVHLNDSNQEKPSLNINQKICPMCRTYRTSVTKDILNHFENSHDITIESETLKFSSMTEFNEWKYKVEEDYATQFRQEASKSSKHHVLKKYTCSRSGHFETEGHGKRRLKRQGSKKINAFCPSSIDLIINNEGGCTVKYIKTHVGHVSELQHMTLPKREKEEIAKKIAQKIPFDIILDEIRESKVNSELKRIHLSVRKDLFNIEKEYQLARPPTRHKNDNDNLQKRQNKLRENLIAIVNSTTSIKEIEALEVIMASMTPTIAAVRDSNDAIALGSKKSSSSNIVQQRKLCSTKNKSNKRARMQELQEPSNSNEFNKLCMELLM